MKNEKTVNPATDTKVVIKDVVVSYVHVLKPWSGDNSSEAKYSLVIIIPKSRKDLIGQIKTAINNAYHKGVTDVWAGKAPAVATLKHPLRDGDVERPEDPVFKDSFFINANSKTRPGIIDLQRRDLTEPGLEEEVYSGMIAHVSTNLYAYDAKGNRGIACGLNNICKVKDGTFLGGRSSAETDFADFLPGANEGAAGDEGNNDIFG